MAGVFLGFCVLLGLSAAVWAVLAAHDLQRTYATSALSTLLYHQIFVAVFGLYGIAGQGIVKMILVARGSSFQAVETVWHLFAIFGAPFLILAWSMFLRLGREIADETPGRGTTRGFLFAALALYIAYGAVLALWSTSKAGDEAWRAFPMAVKGLFVGIDVAVIGAAAGRLIRRSRAVAEGPGRSAIRAFGWTAAAACFGRLAFFAVSGLGGAFFALYVLVFFAGSVLPLVVWRAYLTKSVPAPTAAGIAAGDIGEFSAAFNISKREEEVVRRVLEGKTNREIADTLFITVQTVKDHLYRVFQKADVRSRVQLINLVRTHGSGGRNRPSS